MPGVLRQYCVIIMTHVSCLEFGSRIYTVSRRAVVTDLAATFPASKGLQADLTTDTDDSTSAAVRADAMQLLG